MILSVDYDGKNLGKVLQDLIFEVSLRFPLVVSIHSEAARKDGMITRIICSAGVSF
jgi:hypothetical protein